MDERGRYLNLPISNLVVHWGSMVQRDFGMQVRELLDHLTVPIMMQTRKAVVRLGWIPFV